MKKVLGTLLATCVIPFLLPLQPTAEFLGTKFTEGTEECSQIEGYLGHFEEETNTIALCPDNIEQSRYTRSDVVRHELLHRVQQNLRGATLIPEPFLTYLVRHYLTDGQAFAVALNYDDTDSEFEARVLQHLPASVISGLLIYSQLYHAAT
jgi:hypothetical protein